MAWKLLSFFPYHNEASRSEAMSDARRDCEHRRVMADWKQFRWDHRDGRKPGYVVEVNEEEKA